MTDRAAGLTTALAIFDLDGTLTDPGIGITNSVAHALRTLGAAPLDAAAMRRFIGPPLQDGLVEVAGLSPAQVDDAVAAYRVYFADRGLYENVVYDGIEAVLTSLRERGVVLAVATSKPQVFAVTILEHFGLAGFFSMVAGAELDGSRRHKADVIAHALLGLAEAGVDVPTHLTVMVGDREHDMLGAHAHGFAAVGVTWGYGSAQELRRAGASHLVDTPADLLAVLTRATAPVGT